MENILNYRLCANFYVSDLVFILAVFVFWMIVMAIATNWVKIKERVEGAAVDSACKGFKFLCFIAHVRLYLKRKYNRIFSTHLTPQEEKELQAVNKVNAFAPDFEEEFMMEC